MGKPHILLLAGTGEGALINKHLTDLGFPLITSLAGVTSNPAALHGRILPQGFQDVGGLAAFLTAENIQVVVDATHPFAEKMSLKTAALCRDLDIPYLRYHREPWTAQVGDRWTMVPDMAAAAEAVRDFDRLFLTVGRKEVSLFETVPARFFLLRSVEEAPFHPKQAEVIHLRDRGPFDEGAEAELLRRYNINALVSKNSGGAATYGKIAAARRLGIPVILVSPPAYPTERSFTDLDDLVRTLNQIS